MQRVLIMTNSLKIFITCSCATFIVFFAWRPKFNVLIKQQNRTMVKIQSSDAHKGVDNKNKKDIWHIESSRFPIGVDISLAAEQVKKIWKRSDAKYICYDCQKVCGGWGDRMAGIASSFMWALMTNRKYVIQQNFPCALTTVYKPNLVNWASDLPNGLTTKHITLIDNHKFMPNKIKNPSTHIDGRYPYDIISFRVNQDWIEGFQNPIYEKRLTQLGFNTSELKMDNVFPKLHSLLFKLQDSIQKRLNNFIVNAKTRFNTLLICAQIRMGVNPSIPHDVGPPRNKLEFLSVVWEFLSQFNNSDQHRIFITTDSEDVRQTAKRLFPNTIVDTEGIITHVDRTPNRSQACQGMQKVSLDFHIQTYCDVLMISRSNFGEYGAHLRNSKEGVYGFFNGTIVKGYPPYIIRSQ
ncbi:unnamed protein product [Owenia fusiformis]|uniref:Uncharacterized protein n=1 Tax=Owenia fusiformis TaxID=6347 RepID=A0A8J1XGS8_OWEFU|nr:unnamed protein product [Owenia fusiformis]